MMPICRTHETHWHHFLSDCLINHFCSCYPGPKLNKHSEDTSPLVYDNTEVDGGEGRKCRALADHQLYKRAQSFSDAEVDYARARSLRETNAILAWYDMLS